VSAKKQDREQKVKTNMELKHAIGSPSSEKIAVDVQDSLIEADTLCDETDIYTMKLDNKKRAYIFNFMNYFSRGEKNLKPRVGSKQDVKRLKTCLKDNLKFEVKSFENLTRVELFKELKAGSLLKIQLDFYSRK
jgi:Caspase domain